jgi:hypothetical protein
MTVRGPRITSKGRAEFVHVALEPPETTLRPGYRPFRPRVIKGGEIG